MTILRVLALAALCFSAVRAAPCPVRLCDATKIRDLGPFVPPTTTGVDLCNCDCPADGKLLHVAATSGAQNVANRLLNSEGCDVDVMNSFGNSPMMHAMTTCNIAMVNFFFFEHGANPLKRNNAGDTAICVGARQPSEECGEPVRNTAAKLKPRLCARCGNAATGPFPVQVTTNKVIKDVIEEDGGSVESCNAFVG